MVKINSSSGFKVKKKTQKGTSNPKMDKKKVKALVLLVIHLASMLSYNALYSHYGLEPISSQSFGQENIGDSDVYEITLIKGDTINLHLSSKTHFLYAVRFSLSEPNTMTRESDVLFSITATSNMKIYVTIVPEESHNVAMVCDIDNPILEFFIPILLILALGTFIILCGAVLIRYIKERDMTNIDNLCTYYFITSIIACFIAVYLVAFVLAQFFHILQPMGLDPTKS